MNESYYPKKIRRWHTLLQNLKTARLEKGFSQTLLAERVGISKQYLCDLEHGRSFGSVPVWDRIELALGIPQQILRQTDKEQP